MPDERIKDLSVSTDLPSFDDFEVLDGAANGSRKRPASWGIAALGSRPALLGLMLGDGATANRRVEWALTAAANPAGSALSEIGHLFRAPTSNPVVEIYLWGYYQLAGVPGTTFDHMALTLNTSGDLILRRGTDAANRGAWAILGWRAAHSGKLVRFDFTTAADTATLPSVYQDGVALTGWVQTVNSGTVPNWCSTGQNTTFRTCGFNSQAEFRPGVPVNRSMSAADIAFMVQTGALPPVDRRGGSAVAAYASNFASGTDTFGSVRGSATGNTDGVSDGTTSKDDCLLFWADSTAATTHYVNTPTLGTITSPQWVRLRGSFYIPTGQTAVNGLRIMQLNNGNTLLFSSDVTGAWTNFDLTVLLGGLTPARVDFLQAASGNTAFTGANSASDDRIYLHGITATALGALIQPEITRVAQVLDHGNNRIRGCATSGVRPLSDRDPVGIRGTQSATGFALGLGASDPLWFEPGLITSLRIKQAAASAQTITLRLNTSGGSVIATATTAANTDWQLVALSIPGGFEVASGDRLHWTITGALDWSINWERR
jgi:hypothetical protein